MIKNGWRTFAGKRVLLLQGPVGPFFWKLAKELRDAGAKEVRKVNFNAGDWLFYPFGALNHRSKMEEWPTLFESLLEHWQVDVVFLFGDCRPIHRVAHEIAQRRGVDIRVFEEGYVRPNFVTLERFGVNNHSRLPRDPQFYRSLPRSQPAPPEREVGNTFWHTAVWAFLYYLAACLLRPFFPHYQHHRPLSISEVPPWLRSPWRKAVYRIKERGIQARLSGELSKRYFLVPLQVNTDFQVVVHSGFGSVPRFIEHIVESFARNAPLDHYLVVKHHPMDRGYHDYSSLIERLARDHGLGERLLYIHDQHLPTLLKNAKGVALINSTVGLSALHHGTPLIALGDANYDMEGLTFQGSLEEFWLNAEAAQPDMELYRQFRSYLVRNTQLNGSFYRYGVFERAEEEAAPHRSLAQHSGSENSAEEVAGTMAPVSVHARTSASMVQIAEVGPVPQALQRRAQSTVDPWRADKAA